MEFGISSFTYSWAVGIPGHMPENPMTAMDLVKLASQFQLNRVQFGDNLPLHSLSSTERHQLIAYKENHNIKVEVGMRGLIPDHVEHYLSIATEMHSPFLRLVIDTKGLEPDTKEIIRIIKKLLPSFRKRNIKLAIENHDRFKSKEFVNIINQTDPEWVGICLDTINSMGADQSIHEVLNDLAPYTLNFHVKDYLIKRKWHNLGFDITGAPAGKGMMPIKEILDVLNNFDKCISTTLELWTQPENDIKNTIETEYLWAEESVKYLKQIFK